MPFSMMPTKSGAKHSGVISMKYQPLSDVGKLQAPIAQKISREEVSKKKENENSEKKENENIKIEIDDKGPKVYVLNQNTEIVNNNKVVVVNSSRNVNNGKFYVI
jgi:hypothetical protein